MPQTEMKHSLEGMDLQYQYEEKNEKTMELPKPFSMARGAGCSKSVNVPQFDTVKYLSNNRHERVAPPA